MLGRSNSIIIVNGLNPEVSVVCLVQVSVVLKRTVGDSD